MTDQTNIIPSPTTPLREVRELDTELGSAKGLALLSAAALDERLQKVRDRDGLRLFLDEYSDRVLVPVELQVIQEAHAHATCGHAQELIELDQRLTREFPNISFLMASQLIGRIQLRKLRPLRGQKMVRRYLEAVRHGDANGWHTVVYGMVLALHSIPLRQGLVHYGSQTFDGFINAASDRIPMTVPQSHELYDELCARLPAAVHQVLEKAFPNGLKVV